MKTDVSNNEIDALEKVLSDFEMEWETLQARRAGKWRVTFFISFVLILVISMVFPSFWWMGVAVIAYFAGTLFSMLRLNAKTSSQIIEHQQQLKLVKLLRNFKSSPYSEDT